MSTCTFHRAIQRPRESHAMFKKNYRHINVKHFCFRFRFDWSRIIFSGDHFTLIKTVRLQKKKIERIRGLMKNGHWRVLIVATLYFNMRNLIFKVSYHIFDSKSEQRYFKKSVIQSLGIWLLISRYSLHTQCLQNMHICLLRRIQIVGNNASEVVFMFQKNLSQHITIWLIYFCHDNILSTKRSSTW